MLYVRSQCLQYSGECRAEGAASRQVLELCKALLEAVEAQDRQLSAHEAACFLPCIVEKAGHNAVCAHSACM